MNVTESLTNLNAIKSIYDKSIMAAAAVGEDGSVVYSNTAFDVLFGGDTSALKNIHNGSSYERYIFCGSVPCRLYVTACGEFSVVNVSRCGSDFDGYIPVLSAAVRHAASAVSAATDSLDELFGGDEKLALLLNTIDGSVMTLLSEFLIPEQTVLLAGAEADDFPVISVSADAEKYASDLSLIFADQPVAVNTAISAGMSARIDMKSVRLLLTDFAVKSMEGEYYIDGFGIKVVRSDENMMTMSLACSRISKREQVLSSRAVPKCGFTPAQMLSELLESKFGCKVRYAESADFCTISVDIPCAENTAADRLRSSGRFFGAPGRFSDENIMMARFGINPEYGRK